MLSYIITFVDIYNVIKQEYLPPSMVLSVTSGQRLELSAHTSCLGLFTGVDVSASREVVSHATLLFWLLACVAVK